MKSRISCFDTATFKKDITRFVPLWALYAVGLLLIMLSTISGTLWSHPVRLLDISLEALSLANLLYGALCAQLLFGELFNSRLCNALHAMPVTRSARFVSHICAGLLFAFVPNLLVSALMMPYLGQFWYIALLWLGAICLQYVFFFGVGVLSVMCTGSRFAMVVVYAIINFLALVVYWLLEAFFLPATPGVMLNFEKWMPYCPLFQMVDTNGYFGVITGGVAVPVFAGFGDGWQYLLLYGMIGVVALAGALLLYRRRKLECAGDFIVVRCLGPVFLVLYTLCAGAFVSLFGALFNAHTFFLLVGLLIGFFTGRMLLERTTRVFRKKNFGQLGLLIILLIAALVVLELDVFGIVSYVPEAEDVECVVYNSYKAYDEEFTDPDTIEKICQTHREIVKDPCDGDCGNFHLYIQLEYQMKDGRKVLREYYLCNESQAYGFFTELAERR